MLRRTTPRLFERNEFGVRRRRARELEYAAVERISLRGCCPCVGAQFAAGMLRYSSQFFDWTSMAQGFTVVSKPTEAAWQIVPSLWMFHF